MALIIKKIVPKFTNTGNTTKGKVRIEVSNRKDGKKLNTEEYSINPLDIENTKEYPIYVNLHTGFTHSQNYQSINTSISVNLPTTAGDFKETVELGWKILEKELSKRMTSENMTEVIKILNSL